MEYLASPVFFLEFLLSFMKFTDTLFFNREYMCFSSSRICDNFSHFNKAYLSFKYYILYFLYACTSELILWWI